ncbi:MAG: hypothetical protein G01um10143_621 [Parcubacteria group bacterium Gr01-1014_3]|nr:MAG: hypothetical protein G01um10143_621 [Parcubacteria group bacterium Gr01-1014_3]
MWSFRRVVILFNWYLERSGSDWLLDGHILPEDLVVESLNPAYQLAPSAEIDEQPIKALATNEDCLRVTYIPKGAAGRMVVLIPVRYVISYRETYEVNMRD